MHVFFLWRPKDFKDFKENVKLPPKTSKFARLAQQATASAARFELEADLLDDAPDPEPRKQRPMEGVS